jgi:phage baseplate assembly protein V
VDQIYAALSEHERALQNSLIVAFVSAVDASSGQVKVLIDDEAETDFLPVLSTRAHAGDLSMWLPEVGEQVLVISQGDPSEGFVIGSIPKQADVSGKTTDVRRYSDGTAIEYDKAAHKLTITVGSSGDMALSVSGGTLTITALKLNVTATESVSFTTPKASFSADVEIGGNLSVIGAGTFGGAVSAPSVATGGIAASSGGMSIGKVSGGLSVDGEITAADVKAGAVSLKTHTHKSAAPGSDTSPPGGGA